MSSDQGPEGRPAVRTGDPELEAAAEPEAAPAPDVASAADAAATTRKTGASGYRRFASVLGGVLLAPLATIALLTLPAVTPSKLDLATAARVVDAAALEEEYGIKVTLIAVTADGGLVDLRFMVSDSAKAAHLMHDAASMPQLLVQRNGRVLSASHPLAHKVTVLDGATYFLLYPTSGGAVQGGTSVSVVIDDLRTTPITAQS
jgi:hypothetical protein